jgi:hypothetical protein
MQLNNDDTLIEVPLSKSKLLFLLLLGIMFVAGGLFFIFDPSEFSKSNYRRTPESVSIIIGFACVIFFGAGIVICIVKLFDKKPGLRIDEFGVTINPGTNSSIIKWSSIKTFEIQTISRTKLIGIKLKDPQAFINDIDNVFKRKLAAMSFNLSKTPVSISANSLKCSTDQLYAILTNRLSQWNKDNA